MCFTDDIKIIFSFLCYNFGVDYFKDFNSKDLNNICKYVHAVSCAFSRNEIFTKYYDYAKFTHAFFGVIFKVRMFNVSKNSVHKLFFLKPKNIKNFVIFNSDGIPLSLEEKQILYINLKLWFAVSYLRQIKSSYFEDNDFNLYKLLINAANTISYLILVEQPRWLSQKCD